MPPVLTPAVADHVALRPRAGGDPVRRGNSDDEQGAGRTPALAIGAGDVRLTSAVEEPDADLAPPQEELHPPQEEIFGLVARLEAPEAGGAGGDPTLPPAAAPQADTAGRVSE